MMLTDLTIGPGGVIAMMRGLEQERTTLRVNSSAGRLVPQAARGGTCRTIK
jgi:hypothetical protein